MSTFNLSRWALTHQSFVLFLILLCSGAGVLSYWHLGQAEDPSFTVKAMVVRANWPGARADVVALQVNDRIERTLQEIAEIDYVTSYAKPGVAQLTISLRESVPGHRVADIWYRVRKKLDDMKGQLPTGVQGPFYNDEFGDTFGNLYAFTGDGFDDAELKRFADLARDEFLRIPDVSKVQYLGVQDEVIYVETSSARLSSLGIDPRLIEDTLRSANVVTPAGIVEAGPQRVMLRTSGEFDTVAAIAEIGIQANGRSLRLGDIASIRRGLIDPPSSRMRFNGRSAIGLAIAMREGGDVIRLGQSLETTVRRIRAALPIGVDIDAVSNQPKVVADSVHEFTKSLFEAIAIVLLVSFLSLGWRSGVVVALSIPLVLAITFLCMYALDIDLQRISLGALIIALGLLVDDAIIAVEMMALKLEQGWDRMRAASYAYRATAFPMLTGTLITAAGFLPVGLAKSGAGEYTMSIFQVVGISLIVSWLVAVLFTPYLGFKLLPQTTEHNGSSHNQNPDGRFYRWFQRMLEACLRHRYKVLTATSLAFIGSLALFTLVPQQFFPASSRPELMVDLWLPEAASIAATESAVKQLEQEVRTDPDVLAVTSYVGNGSPRFYLPLDVQLPNTNFGQLMLMTSGEAARERVFARLQKRFDTDNHDLRARVSRLENGPPVGYPIKIRISGRDQDQLVSIATELQDLLRQQTTTRDVHCDAGEDLQIMRLVIDQDKARALGLSSQDIASATQNSLSGRTITQYREGDQLINVVARLEEDERSDLDNLKDAKVYLREGKFVMLSQVAHLQLTSEPSVIWRRNRLPTLTVRADVVGAEAPDVIEQLLPAIEQIRNRLPLGYRIDIGGASESSQNSQDSIAAVVPLALGLILVLLMLQLQNMTRMLLVLLTAPLGMIGVSLVLALFRVPFGFVALLGTIALAGMIMRNSVILLDQIEQDRSEGLDPLEAIVGSTLRRFRPITLTALAAILAMIPLTRSTFWGPMAWAIMGGLSVATLLTLLVLPTLYATVYRIQSVRTSTPQCEAAHTSRTDA
ncbi:multidrug transporter AcrB [Ahniella affigens]|uniref:Multidrug transporter AcrB n=1 Tax=Ahniella affigens TaxID=2021234 RepID=A0A2P1PQQ9_9GAMM|nr:efflux RND transporter permease subunit [Ahniella affigens]AVP97175.1 multidrug transporter AcrB [Ahniella affigens]